MTVIGTWELNEGHISVLTKGLDLHMMASRCDMGENLYIYELGSAIFFPIIWIHVNKCNFME